MRLASEVSRQAGNAAAAASITWRASATDANATCPVTTPVAGFVTGAEASLLPVNTALSAQWEIVLVMSLFLLSQGLRSASCTSTGRPVSRDSTPAAHTAAAA
ncbi:hypothetical protein MCHLDSM_00002 [Mycolicibacterium chlorophenolicum]|uniref:Uncharacterized protein n=1 Tax=Mycolicibacterium chlorophenolicum TaxID=37916 RepID=A0A0J6ZGB6_9MYCO|nr:hypothetical protein MCHLDSM_00002 [Mycolicibacterium chlorophenolicum]